MRERNIPMGWTDGDDDFVDVQGQPPFSFFFFFLFFNSKKKKEYG